VILLRKPLLFLLVLAVGASLVGGGRLSLRLLLDTSVALALIPLTQVVAFAVVYWTGRRRLNFSDAVDAYFGGSGPWFVAVAILAIFGAFASPIVAAQWFSRLAAVAVAVAVVVSLPIDYRFFQSVLGRTPARAAADLVVQRTIGWGVTLAYFGAMAFPKFGSMLPGFAATLLGIRS
jgi:hypothetical protein